MTWRASRVAHHFGIGTRMFGYPFRRQCHECAAAQISTAAVTVTPKVGHWKAQKGFFLSIHLR